MSKFVSDGKMRKVRQKCKCCNRRTSLVKKNKLDGSKVIVCNSCGGEHLVRRANGGKTKNPDRR